MKTETNKAETENENVTPTETQTETQPENKAGGSASLDNIANTLAQSMPDVQEHAINQEKEKNDKIAEQWADLKDVDGNPFNPEIHKTNKAGEPTTTAKGNLIKKPAKKGATGGTQNKSFVGSKPNTQTAPDPQQAIKMQAQASGKMTANLLMTLGIVAGGEEWQPMKDPTSGLDEKAMLESAFADYFEATGKTDIPPGLTLTLAIGGYMLPRFTMPKTQTRLGKLKSWIAKKIADRRLRKHGLKAEQVDK